MAAETSRGTTELDRLAFLKGDWRGEGIQHFEGDNSIKFEVRMMCRETGDGKGIEMIEFDDTPNSDEMIHGEQSLIFIDDKAGKVRLKRTWYEPGIEKTITFLDDVTINEGEMLSEAVSKNGDVYLSTLSMKKKDENTIEVNGMLHFQGKDLPGRVTFKRFGSQ